MITQINEFKVYMINEASYDKLQSDMVDSGKIDQKVFDDVKNNITKSAYGTWILKMIIDKIIFPEDVYKYKEYFDIFDRNKKQYVKKDIFQYKSKDDLNIFLYKTLEIKNIESTNTASIKGVSKTDKYKQFEIGSVDGFIVYELPKGNKKLYDVSCDLGSGTEWCTATGNTRNYFDDYIKSDSLFIFIKGDEKYQLHYKDKQFMDKNDVEIYRIENIESKTYIYDLFKFIKNKYPNKQEYKIPSSIEIIFNDLDNIDIDSLTDKDWIFITRYKTLSEDFMRKFVDKLNWYSISIYQKLSESFIREFKDKLNWYSISQYQKLSESFMREFKDKVDWSDISRYQKLSKKFVSEFSDKVDWTYITLFQNMPYDLIEEFHDKINWFHVSRTNDLTEDFIRRFQDELYWNEISRKRNLTKEFREEFKDKIL